MSWQVSVFVILGMVLISGFVWFERSRPPARIVAAVAALAALGVAGRLALAPIPNVVATTDVALLAGYTLGTGPGFAVGALSGLVSNFWLGQGPWTPWQMAGWGMVGIGGAALAALSGRRMNRWGLAAVGALAGFAYGALLDLSVMVSFGGEQSLDRYLALSARGIPFNVAHAAGNALLMLAAGPAMVRMLDRYRERFEVHWSDVPLARTVAAVAIALFIALPLVVPARGTAATGQAGAMDWLERQQNNDGGYGSSADEDSSVGMTGWAMLGMEAAGTNPADVVSGRKSPIAYLRANAASITSTADLERSILALEGAGVDSRAFAGRDLVAELRDRQGSNGSYEHQVNLTAFAILAQRSAGVPGSNVGKPAAWLRAVQNHNGGWASVEDGESEPDSTGSVLQALAVSPGGGDEVTAGSHWLRPFPAPRRRLVADQGRCDQHPVDRLGDPGDHRRRSQPREHRDAGQHGLRLPHREAVRGRPLRVLVDERPDARLGHGPGADRQGPRAVPDRARRARPEAPRRRWRGIPGE